MATVEIPEFETWVDDDGVLCGRHRITGRLISADTAWDLILRAAVVRISLSLQPLDADSDAGGDT